MNTLYKKVVLVLQHEAFAPALAVGRYLKQRKLDFKKKQSWRPDVSQIAYFCTNVAKP